MSIEQAMLAHARPHVMVVRARKMMEREEMKGCMPILAPRPVALEAPYCPVGGLAEAPAIGVEGDYVEEAPPPVDQQVRLGVWINPSQASDWNRSERLLKHLCGADHRIGMELVGNRTQISIQFLCHRDDVPIVEAAFLGEFELCRLPRQEYDALSSLVGMNGCSYAVYDLYPPPPYSHLLTQPDELRGSPYSVIVTALSFIEPPGIGIYQVLFQAVRREHNWHANVQTLFNMEYAIGLVTGMPTPQRQLQQMPGEDLHNMSEATLTKAHNDKPFFAVSARIGVFGAPDPRNRLKAVATFSNLIQSGGRPLKRLETQDYANVMDAATVGQMFARGITYRPGFLANSRELTTLVHIPPAKITERDGLPMRPLETLPPTADLREGTLVGHCDYAGEVRRACIPYAARVKHVHVLGRSGSGKSTSLEHWILDDIERGCGVAVLDPHNELVSRLLARMPRKYADRVIYADPGDPNHVLLWNPLSPPTSGDVPGLDQGRIADDIVGSFKSFIDGWGDRLEHLLRNSISAVMQLPGGTLRDVADLLRRKSVAGTAILERILDRLNDTFDRNFWTEEFGGYARSDIHPPQHKLSKLLGSRPVRQMLSQPHSAFNLREVMDEGKVLLVNLSTVGSETRNALGSFFLALFHLAALSRSASPGPYLPFYIYCDEAHRFLTDAMDDLISETRKFDVGLVLAHQALSQFDSKKIGSLSNMGSSVIFDVDGKDAQYLLKDLLGKVEVADLVGQKVGHAIARIGDQVVRVVTRDRPLLPKQNCAQEIINASYQRYYKPAEDASAPGHGAAEVSVKPNTAPRSDDEGFEYDTFA